MPEIEIDTGEGVFDPDPGYRGDHEVTCLEHPLHHSEGTFHQGSRSTDDLIPPDFLDRERVAANRAIERYHSYTGLPEEGGKRPTRSDPGSRRIGHPEQQGRHIQHE